MTEARPLDTIRDQAAQWLVCLDERPTPEDLAQFRTWCEADSRHGQVYQQLQQLWQAVSPPTQRRSRPIVAIGLALALPVAIAAVQFLPLEFGNSQPAPIAAPAAQAVFHDRPLPEVLGELDRHRPGLIWSDAASLQGLRFTGVLPLQDTDAALALLQATLPIRVDVYSRYLVNVRPR
ncbi:DUF4880 domain-containing protein [Pseudomonas sp. JQ170]|uniref:DUF4880 domain-containing protein n=1 Tax=unclassified Pseudomonas TaxID=196821 RepID=UPI00264FF97B|nr:MULTISPECIES: DUF4880 domain-containing protein [unclassified Pseudomonas]MDN7139915.1 DUF4880 domain-containing protein [Pseudomonas sp. JQ170]WRO73635.1 DUF4880 domain-containing protein [Pseudomonas sp. 170C]